MSGPFLNVRRGGSRAILGGFATILAAVVVAMLLLTAEGLFRREAPLPRWWWRSLFQAYVTAAVAGISLASLLGLARLGRERELGWLQAARLMPRGSLRLWADRLGIAAVSLTSALLALAGLWWLLGSSAGLGAGQLLWLHAQLLSLGLGLCAALLAWQLRGAGQRVATLGVGAVLLALLGSAIWAPPLLSPWLPSRLYAPVIIALDPLLAAHAAAGQDILRSGLWYEASPLGTSRFLYPSAPWLLLPGLLVLLLGGLAVGRGAAAAKT